MKTEYNYKNKIINVENFQEYIPKKIFWILIRFIIYINILIFGSTVFKIISGVLLAYDLLSFIVLFLIYYVLFNIKLKNRGVYNNTFNINNSAKLLGVDLKKDDINIIKKKYRELSKKHHPDRYINDTKEKQEIAKRNFQKLNTAYNIILDFKKDQK